MPALTRSKVVPGTEGYAEDAESLIPRYEGVSFVEKYKAVLHLLPTTASRILDVGAGTGADAAWLATQGHGVLAVEPTDPLREAGAKRHPASQIEWLDDSLPMLLKTMARKEVFDLVLATAVWMHLAERERRQAMSNIAALLKPGALLIMSLRHGPAPANRRIFGLCRNCVLEAVGANSFAHRTGSNRCRANEFAPTAALNHSSVEPATRNHDIAYF